MRKTRTLPLPLRALSLQSPEGNFIQARLRAGDGAQDADELPSLLSEFVDLLGVLGFAVVAVKAHGLVFPLFCFLLSMGLGTWYSHEKYPEGTQDESARKREDQCRLHGCPPY